jgi:hypothetical protein
MAATAPHISYLPLARNRSRQMERLAFERIGQDTVELYAIRVGVTQTGYARGGQEGPVGPTPVGYGVQVDKGEFVAYVDEGQDLDTQRALFDRAVAQLRRRAVAST